MVELLKILSLLAVTMPLLGAVVVGLGNKKISRRLAHSMNCILVAVSFGASLFIFIGLFTNRINEADITIYIWGKSGVFSMPIGFLLDRLTALMMTIVTFVSLMVHIYSIEYMYDDSGYQRFFSYISLFTFAMLMLVMANNFMQLFFGWEAVGLLSYLLIGFWFKKESANFAGLKAFLINRVGDLGFIIGIAAILYYFESLDYQVVFSRVENWIKVNPNNLGLFNFEWSAINFICICLFIGAMAKSAQIPLHVWLPDSMEGPTPISALIHAATMVTAGIFMVARMSPLFEYSEAARQLMLLIGGLTCSAMALLALVQTDIKRIIAYSTLSQLGYMVVALGVSAYSAAIFHLFTHAFFKALLFLGAGAAILAMHHDQNIFNMGNLRKYMPISSACMLVGGLALIGFPGTAGFYSKDLIIEAAKLAQVKFANFAYWATLLTVFVTTVYTFRLIYVVFFGHERMNLAQTKHLHEVSAVMWAPLVLLAIPSIIVGMPLITPILHGFFGNAIFVLPRHDTLSSFATQHFDGWLSMWLHGFISLPFICVLLGLFVGWLAYIKYPQMPGTIKNDAKILTRVLLAKYGFDALYENLIMPMVRSLGELLWTQGDEVWIDGAMVNGTAKNIGGIAVLLKKTQTGYLYHYVFIIVAGLLALLLWTLYV